MKYTAEHYRMLQYSYLGNFPEDFPPTLISDYSGILRFRNYLKKCTPDRKLLLILLETVINKISRGQRFQKLMMLKLIIHHLNCDGVDQEILVKVFDIYKGLIQNEPDEICWKLSNLLKDRELLTEQIHWLLDNHEASEYILNRLLRYPVKHPLISQWAETAIHNEELANRRAEIIGCILNFRPKYRHKDHRALAWGIYYSKLSHEEKQMLLDKHLYPDNLAEILKICERENYTKLIAKWYWKITEQMDGAVLYKPYDVR